MREACMAAMRTLSSTFLLSLLQWACVSGQRPTEAPQRWKPPSTLSDDALNFIPLFTFASDIRFQCGHDKDFPFTDIQQLPPPNHSLDAEKSSFPVESSALSPWSSPLSSSSSSSSHDSSTGVITNLDTLDFILFPHHLEEWSSCHKIRTQPPSSIYTLLPCFRRVWFRTRVRTETKKTSATAVNEDVHQRHFYLILKCRHHSNGTVQTILEPRWSLREILRPDQWEKSHAQLLNDESQSSKLEDSSQKVEGHTQSKSRKPSSSHAEIRRKRSAGAGIRQKRASGAAFRRKRSTGTEASEVINNLRDNLTYQLQQLGEFPYFNNDLTTNQSVTEHFHHLVLRSRQSIDKQKADSFLRNVLHAVELAVSSYNGGRSSMKDAPRRREALSRKSQQENASKAYERRLVIVVGVVMTALLLATLLMIVAVVSDRRSGRAAAAAAGGVEDAAAVETGSWLQRNWFCVRICPRRFQGGPSRKDAVGNVATRPLPPIPLPGAERGRIDLPPSILQRGGERGSFAMELHL